jgi:hypothetical protein
LSYTVEPIRHDASDREELIRFLVDSPGETYPESLWRARLRFWWEENPAAAGQPWGWTLRLEDRVVGVLAAIPASYEYEGQIIPAAAGSTWRVASAHRSQSLLLFTALLKLSRQLPVIVASPIAPVARLLEKSRFQSQDVCTRHFFLMGRAAGTVSALIGGRGRGFPRLDAGVRITTDPTAVKSVAPPLMRDRITKRFTPEYLQWFTRTPVGDVRFVGCVDDAGELASCVLLAASRAKGFRTWLMVDWFTARGSTDELLALVGEICRARHVPQSDRAFWLLAAVSFPGDDVWGKAPVLWQRQTPAKYYFSLPPLLASAQKRWVLAESDFLL